MMKRKKILMIALTTLLVGSLSESCTKLDLKPYSVEPSANFYQTAEQLAAGVAPAYTALQNIPDGNVNQMNEISSDEIIVPTRGNDWYDGGQWQSLWLHKFKPDVFVDGGWSDLNSGIGKVNFTLNVLSSLTNKPSNYDAVVAELKVLRAYFVLQFMDMYGNIPLVTDYNTDPSKVTQKSRSEVYTFLESELTTNIPKLSTTVDKTTYGKLTQYGGYMILAKLYLNAQVYTGTAQWDKAITALNVVINSGKYTLSGNYLDNFSLSNRSSLENIFVVPFDNVNIGGNNWEMQTLHYQSQATFGLSGQPWNGFCSTADVLNKFDNSDLRKAQFLVGQQYAADKVTPLKDTQTGLALVFDPALLSTISSSADAFRLAGARNVKYAPQSGTAGSASEDMVIFRLADAYLMLAEASLHNSDVATALTYINKVRARAGASAWVAADLTWQSLLDERSREMMWEGWRRSDLIRFEVATGVHYFTGARTPAKTDDGDNHTMIFPIPSPELLSNPNLKQNPGY